jgi:hypothetical protein
MTNQEFEELKAELKEIKFKQTELRTSQLDFWQVVGAVCLSSLLMGLLFGLISKLYIDYQTNKIKSNINSTSTNSPYDNTVKNQVNSPDNYCVEINCKGPETKEGYNTETQINLPVVAKSIDEAKAVAILKHPNCSVQLVYLGKCP